MRLSTLDDRDDERSVAVIRGALDAGATLLDTARAYARNDEDAGHNEHLVARALREWNGDRSRITVATKAGMRRPGGAWVPDGRAKQIRADCEASCAALRADTLDLLQLHAVDPKTSIETSVRALARLQEEGRIRAIGLCNVTVAQIRAARAVASIAAVQVSVSPLDDDNLRNGVAEYCRDEGILLIAYRPLGGDKRGRLAKINAIRAAADARNVTPEEITLAWLMSFRPRVIPIPGATQVQTIAAMRRAVDIRLSEDERRDIDQACSGRLLRTPRSSRRAPDDAAGDVVMIMGMPGAGKSTLARELELRGYERLNRDDRGGSLASLVAELGRRLAAGSRRIVLDNTYPDRASRNDVIETAWTYGVPARCIWMTTGVGQAQVNAIKRMVDVHGSLPSPEEIRARSRTDTRYLLPDAQFRYERVLEQPAADEGFVSIDMQTFTRTDDFGEARAIICDFDDAMRAGARREHLTRLRRDGWLLFLHAWRPGATLDSNEAGVAEAEADIGVCVHEAGPPVCWCRKPIPGSVIEFAMRRGVSLNRSLVIGSSQADRTMAERIGAQFVMSDEFFAR